MRRIPISQPTLHGNEKKYVNDCLDTNWISGGKYVNAFEEQFADFCQAKHAISVANGTVALHVALLGLGIEAGDEVIVPDLTYIASANSVMYCNAKPIFVDVDPVTWTIDPQDITRKLTNRTKAIMPVHLYGHPADMTPILEIARANNIAIIEDAAEAHGAEYNGQRTGSLGDIAAFSFYGNKIITTGEGGMVVTNDDELASRVRLLKGQGMDPQRRYWFPVIGYNYRMTNLQAAIGLAQLERIDSFIERRIEIAEWYADELQDVELELPVEAEWAKNVFWLYALVLPDHIDRDLFMQQMEERGVETRPFFYPMHILPPYENSGGDTAYPVSTRLGAQGINLPAFTDLTQDDVRYVCEAIKICLQRQQQPTK